MPIKPPNQSRNFIEYQGFKGMRGRDRGRDYEQYQKDPKSYKTDRERPTGPTPKRNPRRK